MHNRMHVQACDDCMKACEMEGAGPGTGGGGRGGPLGPSHRHWSLATCIARLALSHTKIRVNVGRRERQRRFGAAMTPPHAAST